MTQPKVVHLLNSDVCAAKNFPLCFQPQLSIYELLILLLVATGGALSLF